MSYETELDWSDHYVTGRIKGSAVDVSEVSIIHFEYEYKHSELALLGWSAWDKDNNELLILSDEESRYIEKYLDDWLHEESLENGDYYDNEYEVSFADTLYEMYKEEFNQG